MGKYTKCTGMNGLSLTADRKQMPNPEHPENPEDPEENPENPDNDDSNDVDENDRYIDADPHLYIHVQSAVCICIERYRCGFYLYYRMYCYLSYYTSE